MVKPTKSKGSKKASTYSVRSSKTGHYITVRASHSSTAAIDRAFKKYSGAMKGLSKR